MIRYVLACRLQLRNKFLTQMGYYVFPLISNQDGNIEIQIQKLINLLKK